MTPTAQSEVNAFLSTFTDPAQSPAPEPASAAQPQQQAADGGTPPASVESQLPTGEPNVQQPAGTPNQDGAPAAAVAEAPKVDLETIAREYGLDLSNQQQRGAAERLLSQQAGAQEARPTEPVVIDTNKLNEALMAGISMPAADPNPVAAAPAQQPPVTAPVPPNANAQPGQPQGNPQDPFGDGFTWKDEKDAMAAFDAAFESRDVEAMGKVQRGLFMRMMAPVVMSFQQKIAELESQLGEVTPEFRQTKQQRQLDESVNVAKQSLRAQLPDFDQMFVAAEGQSIQIDGNQVPATPLNRVIAMNPWIMNIVVEDANPVVSQRKTYAARYEAAYRTWKATSAPILTPEAAKTVFTAGQQAAAVSQQNKVRQSITAPGTPTPVAKPKSYIDEIRSQIGDTASIYK